MHLAYKARRLEKAPLRTIYSTCGGDGDSRAAVNGAHEGGFSAPVQVGELDNAEGVDPEKLEAERAGNVDCVPERFRQLFFWNRFHEIFQKFFFELQEITISPTVA